MTSWLTTSAEDLPTVQNDSCAQESHPENHSFAQRLQEIRRQLEQLTSKGEEKLKIDDVGHWAASCFSASVLHYMLDTCAAGSCAKHIQSFSTTAILPVRH